ncbi:MAG: hypothetical protein K0S20_484 [Patescibacteria group bacterium]|jgi:predicted PurR-regulated permease PerM|nr:hypothetical protein [Patescibacteria group bacterium]
MKKELNQVELTISWEALLRILAFVVGIWLVVILKEVFVMLFGVFIFVAAANPTIQKLQKYMSRTLAVTLFYTVMLAVFALIISVLVPQLVRQANDLVHALPSILDSIRPLFDSVQTGSSSLGNQAIDSAKSSIANASGNIVQTTFTIFGGLATLLTALGLGFYLLLEENNAREFFHQVLPQHRFEAVYNTVSKISERMGSWVRSQLLLMAIIGTANLIVYVVLGIPTPLPLALWAGLCELIPYIGPVLGVLPAAAVAFTADGLLKAVLVIGIGFVLIQQLETHVIVPKLMGRAVGLSPVLVIISITIGAKLLGLTGAILAIPVAAIISVIVGEWSSLRKIWETSE